MVYGDYPDLTHVKKVLVIKLRQLGDVLLTSAVFASLKKALPNAQIDAYIYEEAADMLQGHEAIHQMIFYNRDIKKRSFFKKIFYEFSLLRKIQKQNYDLVINLTEGDRGAVASFISKARIKVGFEPKGFFQKKVYTHVVKHCPNPRHTVEKNLDALRRIGIFPEVEDRIVSIKVSSDAKEKINQLTSSKPFVLIHPTSRWLFKAWSKQKMRHLTISLLEKGKRIVFSSGPDKKELEMVQEIIKDLDVLDLSGKISLKELVALIDAADVVICVDSVPFHICSALKKKVIALFGPTSEINWGPWNNPFATVLTKSISCRPCYRDGCGGSKKSDCLEQIAVEDVLKAFNEKQSFFQSASTFLKTTFKV
jgi:heptosyltransferase-3